MDAVLDVHNDQFYQLMLQTSQKDYILVKFSTSWCAPCKAIHPYFEELAEEYQNKALFLHVDAEKCAASAHAAKVAAYPTFVLFDKKTGEQLEHIKGANKKKLGEVVKARFGQE